MTTIKSFHDRLAKIGIEISLIANYPWIYLDTVNGKRVKGKLNGNHGFTVGWLKKDGPLQVDDNYLPEIFNKIRETLNKNKSHQLGTLQFLTLKIK